jgi:hypothetical protein
VLLCRLPGTGKSAVIAAEVVGAFTVIYVEAKAGEHLLTAVVEEAHRLGGPVLPSAAQASVWVAEKTQDELTGYEFVQWPIDGQRLLAPKMRNGEAVWVDTSNRHRRGTDRRPDG